MLKDGMGTMLRRSADTKSPYEVFDSPEGEYNLHTEYTELITPWLRRLYVSESNRAYQSTMIRMFYMSNIKFFKWSLRHDHSSRLARHGLERDWCDDLAETPIVVSIHTPKDLVFLRDIMFWNATPDGGKSKDSRVPDTNFGVYYTISGAAKRVPTIVHKWRIEKRTQVFTDRVLRYLSIPPHPYCSCVMIPLYDKNNPDGSSRSKKLQHKTELTKWIAMMLDIDRRKSELTRSALKALLMTIMPEEMASLYVEPVITLGSEIIFATPEELTEAVRIVA
jgi:hypothetical protein